jgi:hypothetical protein
MKIDVLMYIEDNKLIVGLRSKKPMFECGFFDGDSYFEYHSFNDSDELLTMEIFKSDDNVFRVYVDDMLMDIITEENSSNFSIDV